MNQPPPPTTGPWILTKALAARGEREGWAIFNDAEVQRIDDDDDDRGFILPDDDTAADLARAAGVPVDVCGYLTCETLEYEKEQ